jgi:hypothetical protein
LGETESDRIGPGHEMVEKHLGDPHARVDERSPAAQVLSLFAVCRGLLRETWAKRLEEAARHIEGVTYSLNEAEQLLTDLTAVYARHPGMIGITPEALYEQLRDVNSEMWRGESDNALGRKVRGITDAEGRQPPTLNVSAGAKVFGGVEPRGSKFYPWKHFEAAWKAYGIERGGRMDQPSANP